MKITNLELQKKDASRYNMYVDDQFFCGVSVNTVVQFNLYPTKELNDADLEELLFFELENRFFERAAAYIAKTPKTEFQVKIYLKQLTFKKKGIWFTDIETEALEKIYSNVINKLKDYNYIDDSYFAELFVSSRIRNKPRGKNILISELMSKGVSKDIAQEKVNELLPNEYDMLVNAYKKKFKDQKITFEDRKKIDFLLRKGFNWDLIEQFINNESGKEI